MGCKKVAQNIHLLHLIVHCSRQALICSERTATRNVMKSSLEVLITCIFANEMIYAAMISWFQSQCNFYLVHFPSVDRTCIAQGFRTRKQTKERNSFG